MELAGAVKGNFHTRFSPEPSGYAHIGHAKAALLASAFAEIYEGKLSLYFDDSNPEKEKQEYVDAIRSDMKWLGIKFDDEYYASDNIPKIYEYARKLITDGKAYACSCSAETMKERGCMRKEACEHSGLRTRWRTWRYFETMLQGADGGGRGGDKVQGETWNRTTPP